MSNLTSRHEERAYDSYPTNSAGKAPAESLHYTCDIRMYVCIYLDIACIFICVYLIDIGV